MPLAARDLTRRPETLSSSLRLSPPSPRVHRLTDRASPSHPDTNTKRETGRTAQLNNIAAAKVRRVANTPSPRSGSAVKAPARVRRQPPHPSSHGGSTCEDPRLNPSSPSLRTSTGRRGYHPHHARSSFHAEDDPRRFRRCASTPIGPFHLQPRAGCGHTAPIAPKTFTRSRDPDGSADRRPRSSQTLPPSTQVSC